MKRLSPQQLEQRVNLKPKLTYPDLPIMAYREVIIEALKQHQVIVIAGETGSGKTTQLPKICLEAGLGIRGLIGHTQPRRIAAKSVASRIAQELETQLGNEIGYEVRFDKRIKAQSYVKIMTDGILLQETTHDRWLNQYDCIIIDEAHERSLNIDFLLGYLKRLIQRRKDLKIIITSATIDVDTFSRFFNDAPIIQVEGRSYPVTLQYLDKDFIVSSDDPIVQIAQTIEQACQGGPGDILVFQSGEKEIRELTEVLSKQKQLNIEVMPLYSKLSSAQQQLIFKPAKKRKVVLSTNIAETSLTVPNIRYVIDTGLARISRYNHKSKLQRLPIEPIAKASCDQRKGRCGRVGPGICYRLFTEEDFQLRPMFTEPEILRTDLSSVILKMLSLRIHDIQAFDFIAPPDQRLIKDAFALLERLHAVEDGRLTEIGHRLARFPIEPRLGRMLIAGDRYAALKELLVIVSFLSIEDVRERPLEFQKDAQETHAKFFHEDSDYMTILNLWQFLFEHRQQLSHNQFRKACQQNFLSYLRVCEWFDIHDQLKQLVQEAQFKINQIASDYSMIHKSILTGLIDSIGLKDEKKEYLGPRNIRFIIHPTSAIYNKPPQWLVTLGVVSTNKNYARMNAKIEPQWLPEIAGSLLKLQYDAPQFEPKSGRVLAVERASLFGLDLNLKRSVNFEQYDRPLARKIFIQQGLVAEQLNTRCAFYKHNHQLKASIVALEDRIRRQVMLYDEHQFEALYEQHLPQDIASQQALELWLKTAGPDALCFSEQQLMINQTPGQLLHDFPLSLTVKGLKLNLDYCFDMTSDLDGVTVIIPVEKLAFLVEADFTYLIPGLLEEKLAFYLKSLPKRIRHQLSPLQPHLDSIKLLAPNAKHPLEAMMQHYIETTFNVQYQDRLFTPSSLPAHLKMHFSVINQQGKVLNTGDDLKRLYQSMVKSDMVALASTEVIEQRQLVQWDFENIPVEVAPDKQHPELKLYPALVDKNTAIEIKLFNQKIMAEVQHPLGLTRCFLLHLTSGLKYAKKTWVAAKKDIAKYGAPFGESDALFDQLAFNIADEALTHGCESIRSQDAFFQRLKLKEATFTQTLVQAIPTLIRIFIQFDEINRLLEKNASKVDPAIVSDIKSQIAQLTPKHFIQNRPWVYLKRYGIYLKAIEERLKKLPVKLAQDKLALQDIHAVQKAYVAKKATVNMDLRLRYDPLRLFLFRIEELRVSLYAQQLGTLEAVSKVRLLKILSGLD